MEVCDYQSYCCWRASVDDNALHQQTIASHLPADRGRKGAMSGLVSRLSVVSVMLFLPWPFPTPSAIFLVFFQASFIAIFVNLSSLTRQQRTGIKSQGREKSLRQEEADFSRQGHTVFHVTTMKKRKYEQNKICFLVEYLNTDSQNIQLVHTNHLPIYWCQSLSFISIFLPYSL